MNQTQPTSDSNDQRRCLQCGQPIDGQFCPGCGQRTDTGPLRLKIIAQEVAGSILDFELPIIRTTLELLTRPGIVAARWIDGERKRYTNPLKFCILVGVVFALLIRFVPTEINAVEDTVNSRFVEYAHIAVSDYLAFVVIVLTIPLALFAGILSKWFRIQRSGLDWYALCLYAFGIAVCLQMITGWFGEPIARFTGLIPIFYVLLATWQFCGRGARGRALLLMLIAIVAWLVTVTIVTQSIAILLLT